MIVCHPGDTRAFPGTDPKWRSDPASKPLLRCSKHADQSQSAARLCLAKTFSSCMCSNSFVKCYRATAVKMPGPIAAIGGFKSGRSAIREKELN